MQSSAAKKHVIPEDELDKVFHALANSSRRRLLARLAQGPAMITELAKPFKMSLPAVSKHLSVLEKAKLVERKVDGRIHRCTLQTEPLREAGEWLAYYRGYWEETLDSLAQFVEEETDATAGIIDNDTAMEKE